MHGQRQPTSTASWECSVRVGVTCCWINELRIDSSSLSLSFFFWLAILLHILPSLSLAACVCVCVCASYRGRRPGILLNDEMARNMKLHCLQCVRLWVGVQKDSRNYEIIYWASDKWVREFNAPLERVSPGYWRARASAKLVARTGRKNEPR